MFWNRTLLVAALLCAGAVAPAAETLRVGVVADNGPAGAALVTGAERAAGEWNASGAKPQLQLYTVRSSRAWHDGASTLARLAFEQDLAAVVGAHDAATAHAVAQIATAKRIPFIAVSPEDGLTRVFDPWIFRGVPADGEQARAMLRWEFGERPGRRVALIVPTGRPGRERTAALAEACAALGVAIGARVVVTPDGSGDLTPALGTDAVLLWLDPEPARAVVARLRKRGFDGAVLGSSRLDDPAFRVAADGVALPQFLSAAAGASHAADRQGYELVRAIAVAAASVDNRPDMLRALAEGRDPALPRFDEHGNRLGAIRVGIVCRGVVQSTTSPCRGSS